MRPVLAGIVYFVLVYMAGFVLGASREAIIAPVVGRVAAVLVEAPLMLVVMTLAAKAVCRRMSVPPDISSRALMGAVAFGMLTLAEAVFAKILRGLDLGQWLASFGTAEGFISLLLFLLFAAMPMLVRDKDVATGRP